MTFGAAMRILATLILLGAVPTVQAEPRSWLCRSVDGVGMSFEGNSWRKIPGLKAVMFQAKEVASGTRLEFPEWLQMEDASCTKNDEAPWISCANGFTLFTLNPQTGDAIMASTGLWVIKEKLKSIATSSPPLGADVQVLRCQ